MRGWGEIVDRPGYSIATSIAFSALPAPWSHASDAATPARSSGRGPDAPPWPHCTDRTGTVQDDRAADGCAARRRRGVIWRAPELKTSKASSSVASTTCRAQNRRPVAAPKVVEQAVVRDLQRRDRARSTCVTGLARPAASPRLPCGAAVAFFQLVSLRAVACEPGQHLSEDLPSFCPHSAASDR